MTIQFPHFENMKTIGIIGSGNVARILGMKLQHSSELRFIHSSTFQNAQKLADFLGTSAIEKVGQLPKVDLLIIAISDDQISEVAKQIPSDQAVVHTSGTKDIGLLDSFDRYGVVYPLQTLGKNDNINLEDVPFLIEGSTEQFSAELKSFVTSCLSTSVEFADSTKRKQLHVAAVFASNFTVQMLIEAEGLMKDNDLNFELLVPLIKETISNCINNGAVNSLTGPAKRNDEKVIQEHLDLLKDDELKLVYETVTNRILSKKYVEKP